MRYITIIFLLSFHFSLSQDTIKTYYLGEVEVTAYRGGGEILNLPMSITAIDFKDFKFKRKVGLSDVLNEIPGVLAQSRSGSYDVRLTVRGFGSRGYGDKSNAATIRGIKILVDGFPETEPDGRTSLDFVDLLLIERIEAIKTNASTLFGNASGGIINFESFGVRNSFAEVVSSYGSYGLSQFGLRSGLKFENWDFVLLGSTLDFNGWRENSSVRRRQVYSVLKTNLGNATRLKVLTGFVSNSFYIAGPLTIDEFNSNPAQANRTYLLRKERRYNRLGRFGLNLTTSFYEKHNFDVKLYFIPKVLQRSERGTFRDFNRYFMGLGITYQYRQDDIRIKPKFIVGYDDSYQDGTILFYNLKDGERGDSLQTNKREAGRTSGLFFKFEIQPLEIFSIIAGARLDMQNYIGEIYPAGVKRITQRDELRMRHLTPSFSILYKVGNNNSAYFTISGGVEAPAFNEVDPPPELKNVVLNPLLKPMSSQTFEFGFKGVTIFDNSPMLDLIYSISLFKINVKNEIVPYGNGSWFFSAGESVRNGIEFGAGVELQKFASVNFSLTYIDAKYVKYQNDIGDFSGKYVPGIPRFWGSAGFKTNFNRFAFNTEFIFVGKYYADDANELQVPGYAILNASVGVEFAISKFSVFCGVGANNLTNRKYIASVFVNPEKSQTYAYIEPGLPRNWFINVSVGMGD